MLDANNSDAMNMGINSTPTMIINGKTTLIGVKSAETINNEITKELGLKFRGESIASPIVFRRACQYTEIM